VQAVLHEYHDHLPLTVRQVFYRLVGAHGFPKTERDCKNLGELLNRARRAGQIRFEHIRDDEFMVREPHCRTNVAALLQAFTAEVNNFRLDRQREQAVRRFFAVEASGMVPQVERVAYDFGIPVVSSGGFDSTTAKHELARMVAVWPAAEILHIGDYDPSGEALFNALAEDVRAFVGRGHDIRFTRLAVTPEQIAELGLPTALPKPTDRRTFNGEVTAQAEAIAPDLLAEIIRTAIHARINPRAYADVLAAEEAAKRALRPILRALPRGGDAEA
jgi:hypothetical protein